jgi:hypothetical protein
VFGLVFFSEPLDSRRSPILRKLIKSTSAHEIRLKNDVTIAVHQQLPLSARASRQVKRRDAV